MVEKKLRVGHLDFDSSEEFHISSKTAMVFWRVKSVKSAGGVLQFRAVLIAHRFGKVRMRVCPHFHTSYAEAETCGFSTSSLWRIVEGTWKG